MGFWESIRKFADSGIIQVKDNSLLKQAIEKQDLTLLRKSLVQNKSTVYKNCNIRIYHINVEGVKEAKDLFNIEDRKELLDETGQKYVLTFDDVYKNDAELASPESKDLRMIKDFKPFLSEEDLGALNSALTIVRLENEGKINEAEKLLKQSRESYTRRGRVIYNWVESNEFMSVIYPKLLSLKMEAKGLGHGEYSPWLHGIFKMFFEKKMEYHERSIYMNASVPPEETLIQIQKRLLVDKVSEICVYTRKERGIRNVKSAVNMFLEKEDGFIVEEEPGKIRGEKSCDFYIKRKKREK